MEENVFPDPAVAEVLDSKFIEARIHTDHEEKGEANRALQVSTAPIRHQAATLWACDERGG